LEVEFVPEDVSSIPNSTASTPWAAKISFRQDIESINRAFGADLSEAGEEPPSILNH